MKVPVLVLILSLTILAAVTNPCDAQPNRSQEIGSGTAVEAQQPEPGEYSGQIIWYDDDPIHALFIPQSVLDRTDFDDLPVSDYALSKIRYAMEFPKDRIEFRFPNNCLYEPSLGGSVREEAQVDLDDWITRRSLAFVGTVVATVPGWSTWESRPVTMVYLRVEEVLKVEYGSLQIGQVVAYSQSDADIELQGVAACSRLPEGVARAKLDDQILFTGARFEHHPFFLSAYYVFPVSKGMVLSQPWTILKQHGPSSLDQIRAAVRSKDER